MSDLDELYQELILDHYRSPRNCRKLADADRSAEGKNPLCGDQVKVFLKFKDGIVEEATFEGTGCAISTASASIMTEAVKGKTREEAEALFKTFHALVTGEDAPIEERPSLGKLKVFAGVGQYPARVKCAILAWHTLDAAMENRDESVSTE